MAGALRKTMVYLGLAEEDENYDAYDRYDEPAPAAAQPSRPVHAVRDAVEDEDEVKERAEVTQLPQRTPVRSVVKEPSVGRLNRITTIHPRTYNEAKTIGESFRDGVPVIMNLSDMADDDAKRLVDFAAGLVFGLSGSIERVTSKVFLLSPAFVEVASEDSDTAAARSLFNQS